MSKKIPFFVEIGLGLVITAFVALSYYKKSSFIETASLKTYDSLSKLNAPAANTNTIQIVEIDEEAVANLGRWPWPRSLVAQLIDEIVASGAKIIGLNIFYTEPEKNQGLDEVTLLQQKFQDIMKEQRSLLQKKKIKLDAFEEFLETDLVETQKALNGDVILAESIEQATNIVLPMYFQPGDALGNNLEPLPTYFDKEKITFASPSTPDVPPGNSAVLPLDKFGAMAMAIGHSNLIPDSDGTLRRIAPVMRYGTFYYPSFAIEVVREFLKLQLSALNWKPGEGFSLLKANIPVDKGGAAFIKFAGPAGTFQRYSAVDVLSGGIPENAFKNKIVLVGVTAPGLAPAFVGPGGQSFTGLEIWANHMENIMGQQFIKQPPWAGKAEWGMILLACLVAVFVLPLVRARFSIPIAAVVFCSFLGTSWFLFTKQGVWVSPAYGMVLLLGSFALIVGRRLIFTERRKELIEAEGAETNKMLGLSFQGQGMLDLAFEKFRKCEVDDSMKELLYNLGLDMERKRQFSKAAAVYEHIATVDSGYKDIKEKIDLLKKAGEGAVFGAIGKKGSDATVVVEGLGQHTTLGRYEVMKELGRGAMGIVYLGKDPKINRQVAIKTLRFEEQMDEEQTKSVKERFFREAESAGNLTHPNIIRIFDAGEDQEVAYIAMELLEGQDLKAYSEKGSLLPIRRVVELVSQVADGLDYAHKQGVVHRDIKPGNVMLLKDGTLRITDFGIARIQATSKTATGAVLGTPAYMSPEQVNGKKADGRADIFSLGVMLYELLTGQKPFYADSIAALLYRIANVPHPDPREFNPKVPAGLTPIIDKAMAKEASDRYQAAGQMAADLKDFLRTWDENAPITPFVQKAAPAGVVLPEKPSDSESIKPQESAPTTDAPPSFLSDLEKAFSEMGTSSKPHAVEAEKVEPPPQKEFSSEETLTQIDPFSSFTSEEKTVVMEPNQLPPSNGNEKEKPFPL